VGSVVVLVKMFVLIFFPLGREIISFIGERASEKG